MCGIFCAVSCHKPIWPSLELQRSLESRGPDSSGKASSTFQRQRATSQSSNEPKVYATFFSTVLSLRGPKAVTQPYHPSASEPVFCWNGEAWSINGQPPLENDTAAVWELLNAVAKLSNATEDRQQEVTRRVLLMAESLSMISGPYAFVFCDSANGLLYFGRDFLGRRSLLTRVTDNGELLISSITDSGMSDGWTEVEADGLYCVDLIAHGDDTTDGDGAARFGRFAATKVPYHFKDEEAHGDLISVILRLSLNKDLLSAPAPLYSMAPAVSRLEELLRESLSQRIMCIPDTPSANDSTEPRAPRLAILFSGGLDCTVLARMAHDVLPHDEPITLLNVAFENPRVHKPATDDTDNQAVYELCPDRMTGRTSYAELQHVCSQRDWRFVAINIPYTETLDHRQKVIALMYPHNTEMDLSISYALYFAARGAGFLCSKPAETYPYTTCARVLLSGLGADELFGGYQRHATAYNRNGFPGLLDELELDVSRLGKRNLGRDDRVISYWGKEARFPYLDEHLLAWALDAPVTDKCGFGELAVNDAAANGEADGSESLEPGKKVLRCLAWKLGMKGVAKERKRAIQFGARTARMETGKTKGTHLLT